MVGVGVAGTIGVGDSPGSGANVGGRTGNTGVGVGNIMTGVSDRGQGSVES